MARELESMAMGGKNDLSFKCIYKYIDSQPTQKNVPYRLLVTSGRIALSVPELSEKRLALARARSGECCAQREREDALTDVATLLRFG